MGFIKLDRDIQKWQYYNKQNMLLVWIDLLTSASYDNNYYDGRLIKKGQCIIGLNKMSTKLGISVQQLRTCLGRLKSANQITCETTNKYTIITILNWDEYQDKPTYNNNQNNTDNNKPLTNEQQTNNKPITTTKEVLEVLEVKESFISESKSDFSFPDVEEEFLQKEQDHREVYECNLFDLFETEFARTISQMEMTRLSEWSEKFEDKIIRYALREAIIYNKRSFDYIDRILHNWSTKGFTVEDIEEGKHTMKEGG